MTQTFWRELGETGWAGHWGSGEDMELQAWENLLPTALAWGLLCLYQCPGLAHKELISCEWQEPGREPATEEERSASSESQDGVWC